MWHEQSREDRDSFVTIVWANIDPTLQFNFSQHITDGDDLGAYDFGSIMHYPHDAFSINGKDTIIPKQSLPSGAVMGQRTALSAGDMAGVHTLYPGLTTIKEVGKDPIIDTTLKEAGKDPSSETVKEIRKDPVTDTTAKEARKDPVTETVKELSKDPTADTAKEIRKDPVSDSTFKEVSKEPTLDTLKEVSKDPVRETTVKEASLDQGPGPVFPGPLTPASPFVLAMPSRAGVGGTSDPVADAAQQVQQLEEAIAQVDQQMAQLLEAYDQAVRALQALQGGQ